MIRGQQATGNMKTAFGLWSAAARVCFREGIRFAEVTPQEARKQVLGEGRPRDPKVVVQQWCQLRGWRFFDDNEADAILTREAGLLAQFGRGAHSATGPWDKRRFWEGQFV